MKEIKLHGLNETIIKETLSNGLNIYIWSSKKAKYFQGALTVLYGGSTRDYHLKNKSYHLHCGLAHYLEHMVCENLEGYSYLEAFNALGSSSNAHTSYFNTTYEFIGTKDIEENLYVLLNNVLKKNFSNEIINRERNPILEEKRMRDDNPGIISYNILNKMLFDTYPIKDGLIGSEKDINEITKEEIEEAYNHFYHPSNMILVVTGNVIPEEVISIVKKYFENTQVIPFVKPKLKVYREKKSVKEKFKKITANIELPEVTINIKTPLKPFKDYNIIKVINCIRLILATNLGSTSLFKEELLEKNLIHNLFFSAYKVYDYIIIEVGARTKYPEEVKELLVNKLKNLDILEEDINRKIKSIIATLVLSYEDPEEVNNIITQSLVHDKEIIDNEKELLESINIKEIKDIFSKISFKEQSILIMNPKNQSK